MREGIIHKCTQTQLNPKKMRMIIKAYLINYTN